MYPFDTVVNIPATDGSRGGEHLCGNRSGVIFGMVKLINMLDANAFSYRNTTLCTIAKYTGIVSCS